MDSTPIEITVNGEARTLTRAMTVAALLAECRLAPERVAVELNERLVRRADFAGQLVRDGDRVEIVTLVGGG